MASFEENLAAIDALQTGEEYLIGDPEYAMRKAKAGLFFDDNAMLEFLAAERFPDDASGVLRYTMKDGEIYYEDYDGKLRKEFESPEDAGVLDEYVTPNLVPSTTFVADMYGGIKGAEKGFKAGLAAAQKSPVKHPLALSAIVLGSTAAGGVGGNLLVGGAARTGRMALIDQFYNLPPEELEAAAIDLGISSAFSAMPFGAGPAKNIMQKFRGREDALKQLLSLKQGVQGTIDDAAKMGIDLTPAEAANIATSSGAAAIKLQFFLSRQPTIVKIQQFYGSRAQKAREAVNVFAGKMGSGVTKAYGSVAERVAAASEAAMKELTDRRKARAGELYSTIRNAPDPAQVDTSKIIAELNLIIDDPKRPESLRAAATGFRSSLMERTVNEAGEEVEIPLTNLMDIHDRRTTDMEAIVKANLDTSNAQTVIDLRRQVTDLLGEADPLYDLARRVYDPTKPNLQATERSAIGKISRLFKSGDKGTAKAVQEIFNPDVSTRSLRNARRVLQAQDPELWKDVKKYYINAKLDDFTKTFTVEQGLPQFQRFFATPKNKAMMEVLLEPEEFQNFNKLIGFLDLALNKVQKGASDTQMLQGYEKVIARDAGGIGTDALALALAAARLPGRLLSGSFGDGIVASIAMKQKEVYFDKIVDVMLNAPDASKSIDEAYNYFSRLEAIAPQAGLRVGEEAVEAATDLGEQEYRPTDQQRERMLQQLEQTQKSPISSIDVPIFEQLPATQGPSEINPAMSPTVLPSAEDRELAMRRQDSKGIAGLM